MDGVVSVLVVDDQEPFRAAAATIIAATDGFELAATAATAEEAVRAVDDLAPDLVLMDVDLGSHDGVELTRTLLDRSPGLAVWLVSTLAEEDLPADAATCGARGYLPKVSVSPASLRRAWLDEAT